MTGWPASFDRSVVRLDAGQSVPGRQRSLELISLAGTVGDPVVQAALISLDTDRLVIRTKYGVIEPLDKVLRALSS